MLMLVGTGRWRTNSPYCWICTGPTEMSALRRMKFRSELRRCRAKRSLMTSSVCIRPRTTRSGAPRS
jgi:hypothetical protein